MVKEGINCQIILCFIIIILIIIFSFMFYPLHAKVYGLKFSSELKKKKFATNSYS
jgi:hypothetical protein